MGKIYAPRQTFHAPLIGVHLNIVHYGIIKALLKNNSMTRHEITQFLCDPGTGFLVHKNYRTKSGKTQLSHQYFGQCIEELKSANFVRVEENRKPFFYELVPEFKEKLYNLLFSIDRIEELQAEIKKAKEETFPLTIKPANELKKNENDFL